MTYTSVFFSNLCGFRYAPLPLLFINIAIPPPPHEVKDKVSSCQVAPVNIRPHYTPDMRQVISFGVHKLYIINMYYE